MSPFRKNFEIALLMTVLASAGPALLAEQQQSQSGDSSSSQSSSSQSPGSSSSSPQSASQTKNSSSSSSQPAPAQSAAPAQKPSTAEDNPFPEDISRKAAEGNDSSSSSDKPPVSSPKPNAPGAASSKSESSSRSELPSLDELNDTNRISNGAGGYIENPKLAVEDVRVGGFYLDRRDYKGAYLRYKEATLVDPANADAVFGLAVAAQGLKQKEEAVQNFQLYLDAFPDGKKAKDARKALATLGTPAAPAQ